MAEKELKKAGKKKKQKPLEIGVTPRGATDPLA